MHILDLSSDADDKVVEVVINFFNADHANGFAQAYVRDSVERCRIPGASNQEIFEAWSMFGEDAKAIIIDGHGWESSPAIIMGFIEEVATPMQRDWRAFDPRRFFGEDEFPEDEK